MQTWRTGALPCSLIQDDRNVPFQQTTDLVNLTRGEGLMSHLFREYAPFKGEIGGRRRGVMVSMESGVSTAYALNNIQERGRLFIGPQEDVYEGMIVGENARNIAPHQRSPMSIDYRSSYQTSFRSIYQRSRNWVGKFRAIENIMLTRQTTHSVSAHRCGWREG